MNKTQSIFELRDYLDTLRNLSTPIETAGPPPLEHCWLNDDGNLLHTLFSIYGATLWLHSRDFDIQDFFDMRVAPIFLRAQANAGAIETTPICAGCKEPAEQWVKYLQLAVHDRLECKVVVAKMHDECSELTVEIMQAVLDEIERG